MATGVYLLHFDKKYHHAGHYLGCSVDINTRTLQHGKRAGGRLCFVVHAAGIEWVIARTWTAQDWQAARKLERKLKRGHNNPRLCPICKAERK